MFHPPKKKRGKEEEGRKGGREGGREGRKRRKKQIHKTLSKKEVFLPLGCVFIGCFILTFVFFRIFIVPTVDLGDHKIV